MKKLILAVVCTVVLSSAFPAEACNTNQWEYLITSAEHRCENCDLSDCNLSSVALGYAFLQGANLSGAHLEGADLSFATWVDGNKCDVGTGCCKRNGKCLPNP